VGVVLEVILYNKGYLLLHSNRWSRWDRADHSKDKAEHVTIRARVKNPAKTNYPDNHHT